MYSAKLDVGLVEMGLMMFLTVKEVIVLGGKGPNC